MDPFWRKEVRKGDTLQYRIWKWETNWIALDETEFATAVPLGWQISSVPHVHNKIEIFKTLGRRGKGGIRRYFCRLIHEGLLEIYIESRRYELRNRTKKRLSHRSCGSSGAQVSAQKEIKIRQRRFHHLARGCSFLIRSMIELPKTEQFQSRHAQDQENLVCTIRLWAVY